MNFIKTDRLVLKPMCKDYLKSTHEYAADLENTKYMMFLPNSSLEETLEFLKGAEAEFLKKQPSFYEMAVFHDGVHIGAVSLYLNEAKDSGELGWILNKRYHGHGFATEAAKALLDYAVKQLGVMHFTAHCDTENAASRKVMEKLGMVLKEEHGGRKNRQSDEERREYTFELNISE